MAPGAKSEDFGGMHGLYPSSSPKWEQKWEQK